MPAHLIPSLSNVRSDRVRSVRALSGRSARSRAGRFLVEGPQSVREAVLWQADTIVDLYLTPAAGERYPEILDGAQAAAVRTHIATPDVVATMSPDAQGLVAVLVDRRPQDSAAVLLALRAALANGARLVAVLSQVRDPGNAGTVIRAADAAGADVVILTDSSVDLTNTKVIRSTAGSLFHLPVFEGGSLAEVVAVLREAGLAVLAADGAGDIVLDELLAVAGEVGGHPAGPDEAPHARGVIDLAVPTAWVFGNEAWGLSDEERQLADAVVRVPIYGRAESLNLATAATVCIYASAFAQR